MIKAQDIIYAIELDDGLLTTPAPSEGRLRRLPPAEWAALPAEGKAKMKREETASKRKEDEETKEGDGGGEAEGERKGEEEEEGEGEERGTSPP